MTGKKLGPHTLRHSGASSIAKATKSTMVAQEKLQHADYRTSQLYIHDAEEATVGGVSVLDMVNVQPVETLALVPVIEEHVDVTVDLTDQMFDNIPDGVKVRPFVKVQ